MDLLKKSVSATILLLIVAVAWAIISIYFKNSYVDVNPNATTYTKQMQNSFNTEELDLVIQKAEKSFSVSPSEFLSLTESPS
jgi:archaellum component FlaF (FlaF/FlaG flagellin family)